MKQSLNKDTLAYQMSARPGIQLRDVSSVPLRGVVKSMNEFMSLGNVLPLAGIKAGSEPVQVSPNIEALIFYMLNHAVSIIRQQKHVYEPLGASLPIVETYHDQLSIRSARMFYYLLLICTRESRHEKTSYSDSLWINLRKKYGTEISSFHQSIKGGSPIGTADKFRASAPDTKLGNYTQFLSEIFHTGKYHSSYGGKAWAAVADVLRDFVHGKITAEMMMDTAFTLAHNNGPIFNKGMLFDQHTNDIYTILDVQRSGQIPQLVGNKESQSSSSFVTKLWDQCHAVLGSSFEGHVDWFLVEELGAMKTYSSNKNNQVAKYGYPSKFKAKLEAQKLKEEQAAAIKLEEMKDWVQIMPNVKIKKVKVPR